jgi:formate hydrogenlyase transcriptional activator
MIPPKPANETQRLATLRTYGILDTKPETAFDDLTSLASYICQTPIALISFVDSDRQWFKSKSGVSLTETSRDIAFCASAILQSDIFVVPDTTQDERFAENPLVVSEPKIRFYAGAPLIVDGQALGTLCVIDRVPRKLSPEQLDALRALSRQVQAQLELRRDFNRLGKQAQEVLRQSEERWRAVFDNSAIGVALTDHKGHFLAANPVYQKMLGYSEAELQALSFLDITHEDYRESNWALVAELLEGKRRQFQIEKQYRRKDGSLIWVSNNVSLVPGTDRVPRFIMALSEDITERKQAEETLQSSEERVRLILDSVAEAIFGCDPEGICLFCNRAAARLLGYDDRAELLGKSMHVLEHHTRPDGTPYPLAECPIYVGLQKGEGVHREDEVFWRKDGTSFPVEYWSHPIFRDGSTVGAVITFIDITERKRAEEALRKSEQRKHSLLEINNAIITNLTHDALHHAICEALRRVLPVDRASLALYQPDRDTLRIVALEKDWHLDFFRVGTEMSVKDSHHGWVFEHQRPLLRRDVETEWQYPTEQRLYHTGLRSFCLAPLVLGGKSIGTLGIGSDKVNQYSEADAEFLCEVASQVALAAVNMRSYEEIAALNAQVTRTAERRRALLEINNAIITNLTEQALLESVSVALARVMPVDQAVLSLYERSRDTFRILALEGPGRSGVFKTGFELGRQNSHSGWVFDHQRPLLIFDLETERRFPTDQNLLNEGIRSFCLAPLTLGGKSIGTIGVASWTKKRYSEEDAELLQEVGNQVAMAVENMKAYEEIRSLKTKLEAENVYLQEELLKEHNFDEIVGNSPALMEVLQKVEMAAPTDATVLLYGETGTGKEVIARAIHSRSARKARAMVTVNCGAIPAGLVESELFGHVKGAFTGALHNVHGRFELADGSTLFLDEVGELPAETQIKLLRVLQEHEFQVVGSGQTTRVDVRIIAATNRNLEEDVRAGRFRSDLFYRLNVLPLNVPPLRERRSDIPQLVLFFLGRSCQKFGKKIEAVSQDTMDQLTSYDWPGNIRELQNIVERGVVLSNRPVLTLDKGLFPVAQHKATPAAPEPIPAPAAVRPDSGNPPGQHNKEAPSPPRPLEEVERDHIVAALEHTMGIIDGPKGAAKILELHPSTLRARMKKLGIERLRH